MSDNSNLISKFTQKMHLQVEVCDHLVKVRDAFINGIQHVISLALLPSHSALYAESNQYAKDLAVISILGVLDKPRELTAVENSLFQLKYHQYCEAVLEQLCDDQGRTAARKAAEFVGKLFDTHPQVKKGTNALIANIPVSVWTAFEVLMVDLWIAAVNAKTDFAEAYTTPLPGAKEGKQVQVASLVKYGGKNFDLSKVMGDVLYREEKAELSTIVKTKKTYERTFGAAPDVFDDPNIRLLELLRNLLVHNNGIVDQKFIDCRNEAGLSKHSHCANIEATKPFPLNGDLAFLFMDTVEACGVKLLKFVDGKMI